MGGLLLQQQLLCAVTQGWCNNVAWNVGPLTCFQYQVAIDRHDFYHLHRFHSIIPMIQLSWNLARDCPGISGGGRPQLLALVQSFIGRSLAACAASLKCAAEHGKEVKWHGRVDGEPAHYCENCEVCCEFFSQSVNCHIYTVGFFEQIHRKTNENSL